MCHSYCNSCSYCVSQCTCTNPTLVIPNPTPPTGCISTNYGRCIYYSGSNITCGITANAGENLDVIVNKLATAICSLTPADLAWNTFNYQCLREDGSLTNSGPSNITTAKEFAEAVSIALCTLSTAVDITPNITISGPCSAYFSGLVPGTSTLVNILNDFIVKLCALNATNDTSTVNNSCSAGTWTTVPASGSTLGTWVNWIKTNVCSLVTSLQTRTTNLETFQTNVYNFVGDPTLSLFNNIGSCILGSGSDSLVTTISLIKTKLCSINTTVAALPNLSALTLNWASYPCVFSYANTNTLQNHLQLIITELFNRTYNFSGDFVVASGSCGKSISLASPGGSFTCADLGTCVLSNLGDVNSYSLGTGATFNSTGLFWNSTSTGWSAKKFGMTSVGGTCSISYLDNDGAGTLTYNIESDIIVGTVLNSAIPTPVNLVKGTPTLGSTPLTLEFNPSFFTGTPVGAVWNFAPPSGVLVVGPSTAAPFTPPTTLNTINVYLSGGKIEFEGQMDLTILGTLTAGVQYNLGAATVAIPTVPGPFPVTWNSGFNVIDSTSGIAFPIYLGQGAGTLFIYPVVALTTGTYTLSVGGTSFKLY